MGYTISVSPDGSLCASGGKDGTAMLWDVNDGKHLYSLDAGSTINALSFSPKNYWLVAATDTSIKVWDLENKNVLDELSSKDPPKSGIPWCVSLTWSADGNILFAGSTWQHLCLRDRSSMKSSKITSCQGGCMRLCRTTAGAVLRRKAPACPQLASNMYGHSCRYRISTIAVHSTVENRRWALRK